MIITDSVEGSEEDILVAGEHRGGDSSGGGWSFPISEQHRVRGSVALICWGSG